MRDRHPVRRVARRLGATVVGADFSTGMLDQAAARTRAVAWLGADALHLPVRDGSIDAALSTESFHWFPDPDGALRELARVLAPGGHLLVALINPTTTIGSRMLETASRALGQPARWPTRAEMARLVERAGFDVVTQDRVARLGALLIPTVSTLAVHRPSTPGHQGQARAS